MSSLLLKNASVAVTLNDGHALVTTASGVRSFKLIPGTHLGTVKVADFDTFLALVEPHIEDSGIDHQAVLTLAPSAKVAA